MRTQSQPCECERTDLAIVREFLVRLEPLQRVDRVVFPLAIGLAVEVTTIGERLLNLGIAVRIGMELITRTGRFAGDPPLGSSSLCGRSRFRWSLSFFSHNGGLRLCRLWGRECRREGVRDSSRPKDPHNERPPHVSRLIRFYRAPEILFGNSFRGRIRAAVRTRKRPLLTPLHDQIVSDLCFHLIVTVYEFGHVDVGVERLVDTWARAYGKKCGSQILLILFTGVAVFV